MRWTPRDTAPPAKIPQSLSPLGHKMPARHEEIEHAEEEGEAFRAGPLRFNASESGVRSP
ncbi:MAG: hypothetical protein ACLSAH_22280 [Bilophila wadsworthia]